MSRALLAQRLEFRQRVDRLLTLGDEVPAHEAERLLQLGVVERAPGVLP